MAWITGGSSGIGLALAVELASRGYKVAISARNFELFDELVGGRPELKDKIFAYPCDVTNGANVAATLQKIVAEHGPVALAVLNAGNYIPVGGDALAADDFRKTFDVNFHGVINGLVPVIEHMHAGGRGQIAITGSVTSYAGLPTAAAYGASKAALNSMAQSLKFDLDRMNIRIQMCNPGFVDSELTKKNDFPMPGLMYSDRAARRYADGMELGGFEIRYPRRLAWPLRLVSVFPSPLYFWLIAKITGADKPLV